MPARSPLPDYLPAPLLAVTWSDLFFNYDTSHYAALPVWDDAKEDEEAYDLRVREALRKDAWGFLACFACEDQSDQESLVPLVEWLVDDFLGRL